LAKKACFFTETGFFMPKNGDAMAAPLACGMCGAA